MQRVNMHAPRRLGASLMRSGFGHRGPVAVFCALALLATCCMLAIILLSSSYDVGPAYAAQPGSEPRVLAPRLDVDAEEWRPGLRIPVTLHDGEQDVHPGLRDGLDASRDDVMVPVVRIGSPLTAAGASSVVFYPNGGSFDGGVAVPSRVPDATSARLHIDTGRAVGLSGGDKYEMISINMGFSASEMQRMMVDARSSSGGAAAAAAPAAPPPVPEYGTNWLHLDLRSLVRDLGADRISDAAVLLYFGGPGPDSDHVTITERLGSPAGLVRIDPDDVRLISSKSGPVHLVLDLARGGAGGAGAGAGALTIPQGSAAGLHAAQPVIIDVFSFGVRGPDVVSNAIYRMELEESSRSSGVFEGTLEFAVADHTNAGDPGIVLDMVTVGRDIRFVVPDVASRWGGVTVAYSDLVLSGTVVPAPSATAHAQPRAHAGTVSLSTPSGVLRFGVPVTITLYDPDLNLSADTIEVYSVVDEPGLPSTDTVGRGHAVLLEVKIKDIRYKRCMVDGVEHGGLASTGFSLVETGPATGVFEGVFKMPTWICDKTGSKLISSAGGSLDVVYRDARDSSGNESQFGLQHPPQQPPQSHAQDSPGPSIRGHTGSITSYADDAGAGRGSNTAALPQQPAPGGRILADTPSVFLSPSWVVLRDVGYTANVTLSGSVAGSDVWDGRPGSVVSASIAPPGGGPAQEFDLRVRADGRYGAVLTLEGGADPQGSYEIALSYGPGHLEMVSFYVESGPLVIPHSIRDSALGWSNGTRADGVFAADVLRGLEDMDLILLPDETMPGDDAAAAGASPVGVPPWFKNTVAWWAGGLVPDDVFVASVQYVVDNGVLVVGN